VGRYRRRLWRQVLQRPGRRDLPVHRRNRRGVAVLCYPARGCRPHRQPALLAAADLGMPAMRATRHRPCPKRTACPRRARPRPGLCSPCPRPGRQLLGLILNSEPAVGLLQRHWLRERITDDCPRCGWHGYFHHYLATIDGDWAAAVCDDCYADLHPDITVTVKYYSARLPRGFPRGGEVIAAIRQRTRSDHDYPDIGHFPDIGQQLTWRLWWEHTAMLVEEAHGSAERRRLCQSWQDLRVRDDSASRAVCHRLMTKRAYRRVCICQGPV